MKSKCRIKILSLFYILSLINSTIITEGYHFFDNFYYRDMYKSFLKQRKSNKCSIDEGPNCFFIQNKNESQIEIELKNIFPENSIHISEKPEEIYVKLKNSTKSISEKDTSTIEDEVFEFDSPYVMTLLLSFESYDEKTSLGDIYAPETIDTPFDLGRVTLTIIGKLRLSQKDCEKYHSKIISKEERPQRTYAYVESKEVIIKFNVKSTISSMYIKKNKYNQNNKTFYLYGYKNGNKHLISKIQNVPNTEWIRINGDGKKYESIGLMRGFDYDNIAIMSSLEGLPNYNQLTKQFSSFIKEKIRTTINEEVDKIKGTKGGRGGKDKIKKGENDGIRVIKINIDQEDIIKNDKEEDFNLSEEFLNEVENSYKNEKLEHDRNNNIKKDVNNDNNNINENNKNEDL